MRYKKEYVNIDARKDMQSLVAQLSLILEQPLINTKVLSVYVAEIKDLIKKL